MKKLYVPEASPKPSPERAIYGFVLYLTGIIGLCLYFVWALVPLAWLESVGLTYWPQKYWAFAGPVYFAVAFIFIIIFYIAGNFTLTAPLNSINTITDEYAKRVKTDLPDGAIPPIGDMNISEVNKLLYMDNR